MPAFFSKLKVNNDMIKINYLQLCLLLILLLSSKIFQAQILSVNPLHPTVDSTISIIYDASEGNAVLSGYTGDVYMHTGVITSESGGSSDWKYVVADWCENTSETRMTSLGNNLYSANFHIRSFYNIPEFETVLQLAFVFRSADCSLVGRDINNQDILYDLSTNITVTEYDSHELSNDTLFINCNNGTIIITPYNEKIINVFSGVSGEENQSSYSTIAHKQTVDFTFVQEQNLLIFATDSVEVIIDTASLQFDFVYNNDTVLHFNKIYEFESQGTLLSKLKEDERIYGSGSRAINLDLRGRNLAVNNQANWGYGPGAENLNITLPVVNSSEKYMLYYDNHSIASFDVGLSNSDQLNYTFSNGQADLFVITGKDHGELLKHYSFLTGYQPLPPIWSLGYIQSKYGYETQLEASNIVTQIKNAGFPIDALVLDLYWFGNPNTMGNLDWDFSRFPNPEAMMSDLKNQGVKTILITEPYFTLNSTNYSFANDQGYFAKQANGQSYVINGFWAGNAALLDLFHPDVPQWFNQFYTDRTNEGVTGWWTDLGEPETHPSDMFHYGGKTASEIHNVYGLQWNKIVYDNWISEFQDKRLFNLTRSGFAGMQRYSTFPWSGDVQRSFGGLRVQIPIMLSLGLNGIPYMHSDIGGFTGGGNDDELFVRWVQMGIFSPVFRIHGAGIETSPTAYSTQAQDITRKYIKWRYKLLPYNYTLAYQASTYGLPFARTMDFYDPTNESLQNINNQYYWGENLIIAPIVFEGQSQREVILPKGVWISYHNLQNYQGPGSYYMPAPLEDIPVLVKAGSFIPTVNGLQNTDEYTSQNLVVQYFPDRSQTENRYTLFDDDKTNPNSLADNEFALINFEGQYHNDEIQIQMSNGGAGYPEMPERNIVFEIFRIVDSPETVLVDEVPLQAYADLQELEIQESGYYFSSAHQKLYVKLKYDNVNASITIEDIFINSIELHNAFAEEMSIFPTPGADVLYVKNLNPKDGKVLIKLFDIDGKAIIETTTSTDTETRLNTSSLRSGLYFVQITSKNSTTTFKWIKY